VLSPNNQLPKCTKTRVKLHKIAYKTSKNRLRRLCCPRPRWGSLLRFE